MKKILILFLLLVFASPVYAAYWLQIGVKNWVDLDSLKINKYGMYTAWFKDLNPGNWDLLNNKKIWYQLTLIEFNCYEHLASTKSYAAYGIKGDMIDSYHFESSNFVPIVPDSIGELKYNIICRPEIFTDK